MQKINQIYDNSKSLEVDAYVYSNDFEKILARELNAFFSVLDFASSKIELQHQSRILTKVEHSHLIKAQLAIKLSLLFNLDSEQGKQIAANMLIEGSKKALAIAGYKDNFNSLLQINDFDIKQLVEAGKYRLWHDTENLLELSANNFYKDYNISKSLNYLCQLIIYTFTPKDPSQSPDSLIVTPEVYFNLTNMWACRPDLYENGLALSASGKKIIYKDSDSVNVGYRKDLGLLADLHLQLANQLWQYYKPIESYLK